MKLKLKYVMKLKNSNHDETQQLNYGETQKLKMR